MLLRSKSKNVQKKEIRVLRNKNGSDGRGGMISGVHCDVCHSFPFSFRTVSC
jgi:hypothetical protein